MSNMIFLVNEEAIPEILETSACSLERSHLHFKRFVQCCYSEDLKLQQDPVCVSSSNSLTNECLLRTTFCIQKCLKLQLFYVFLTRKCSRHKSSVSGSLYCCHPILNKHKKSYGTAFAYFVPLSFCAGQEIKSRFISLLNLQFQLGQGSVPSGKLSWTCFYILG